MRTNRPKPSPERTPPASHRSHKVPSFEASLRDLLAQALAQVSVPDLPLLLAVGFCALAWCVPGSPPCLYLRVAGGLSGLPIVQSFFCERFGPWVVQAVWPTQFSFS